MDIHQLLWSSRPKSGMGMLLPTALDVGCHPKLWPLCLAQRVRPHGITLSRLYHSGPEGVPGWRENTTGPQC